MKKKDNNNAEPARGPQRTRPPYPGEVLLTKGDDEPLLATMTLRDSVERQLRRLLLGDGRYATAALALMTRSEIGACVQMDYAVMDARNGGDDILLVPRAFLAAYNGLVMRITAEPAEECNWTQME